MEIYAKTGFTLANEKNPDAAVKVLIAVSDAQLRSILSTLIQQHCSSHPEVVEASVLPEGLDRFDGSFDLALIGPEPIGTGALAQIHRLTTRWPNLPVVLLSESRAPTDVEAAFRAGAKGYLSPSVGNKILLSALHLVTSGGTYIPPFVLDGTILPPGPRVGPAIDRLGLTPRQRDVLALLGRGITNRQIAQQLGLKEGTIKLHVAAILKALHVVNRTQAVIEARKLGAL